MLNHLILKTPLIRYLGEDVASGVEIYLKAENLQPFGSYKIRGVANLLRKVDRSAIARGLSAASAGNMAQAVAYGARIAEVPCKIFVPETAPQIKKDAIRKIGAELVELPYDEVWKLVRGETAPPGDSLFVHPAFCPELLEGYGEIANEILSDVPDVDAIVIPFGVGGLTLGLGQAFKKQRPRASIYPCEPETAAPLHASLRAGRPVAIQRKPSFIDAIGTPEVLPGVFELVRTFCQESLVVDLESVRKSMHSLLATHKLLCEGAAAASLTASLQLAKTKRHRKIVCILSGGNLPVEQICALFPGHFPLPPAR